MTLSNYISREEFTVCRAFALKAGILTKRKDKSRTGGSNSFIDKTMQEFLAAYYIARNARVIDDIIDGYLKHNTNSYLDISQVFKFLCGMNIVAANTMSGLMNECDIAHCEGPYWLWRCAFQEFIMNRVMTKNAKADVSKERNHAAAAGGGPPLTEMSQTSQAVASLFAHSALFYGVVDNADTVIAVTPPSPRFLGLPIMELLTAVDIPDPYGVAETVGDSPTGLLSDQGLGRVAVQLGAEWKTVAIELGLKQVALEQIQTGNPHEKLERHIFLALIKWRDEIRHATDDSLRIKELLEAITIAGRADLAQHLREQLLYTPSCPRSKEKSTATSVPLTSTSTPLSSDSIRKRTLKDAQLEALESQTEMSREGTACFRKVARLAEVLTEYFEKR